MTLTARTEDCAPVPGRAPASLRLVAGSDSAPVPIPPGPPDDPAARAVDTAVRDVVSRIGSRTLVLEGPAGATALADRALRRVREARLSVVRHRVTGLDRVVPLAALRTLFAELTHSGPFRTEQDLAHVLADATRRAPVAVVLDDVDRCDHPTARVLERLIGAAATAPVLWVLTRRTSRPALPSAGNLRVLQERAGPNAGCASGGSARPADGGRRAHGQLSPPARRLLDALVVLDRPATAGELASVVGLDRCEVGAARSELLATGLLDGRTDVLVLRPASTAVLGNGTAPAVRAVLHRAAACLPGTDPVERVQHLLRGGRVPDIRPGGELERVVEHRAATDPAGAAALVLRTLDLLPAESAAGPDRARLLASGIRLLCRSGDPLRATVLGTAADARRPEPAVALAEATYAAGRAAEAGARIDRALAADPPAELRYRLHALRVHVSVALNDPAAARGSAATVPADVPGAPAAGSAAALVSGDVDGAVATLRTECGRPTEPGSADWWHGTPALLARDRPAAAGRSLVAARRRCTAVRLAGWYLRVAETRLAAGRLGPAAAATTLGLRLEPRWPAVTLELHAVAAEIALVTGAYDTARSHLGYVRHLRASGVAAGPRPGWAALQLAVHDGSPDAAEPLAGIDLVQLSMLEPRAPVEVVRAYLGAGAADRARDVAERTRALAARSAGRGRRAASEHATGLAHADTASIVRAATAWRDAGRLLPAAHAWRDVADLTGDSDPDRAAAARRAAAAGLRDCGATAVADRLDREAGRAGRIDPPGWGSLTAAELRVVHQVALGSSNREAASTLCLSRHTVDTHLRHVFAKLGVTNRVALTAVVHAREPAGLT